MIYLVLGPIETAFTDNTQIEELTPVTTEIKTETETEIKSSGGREEERRRGV